jgi:hypothetical protein
MKLSKKEKRLIEHCAYISVVKTILTPDQFAEDRSLYDLLVADEFTTKQSHFSMYVDELMAKNGIPSSQSADQSRTSRKDCGQDKPFVAACPFFDQNSPTNFPIILTGRGGRPVKRNGILFNIFIKLLCKG